MRGVTHFLLFLSTQLQLGWTALDVDIVPKSILQPAGTSVMLHCQTSPSDAIITWWKDKLPVAIYPKSSADADSGLAYALPNNTLYIKKLKRRLTGTYLCRGSYGAEQRSSKAVVETAFIQKFTPMADVKAYENEQATIVCPELLGKPAPTLSWYFENTLIPGENQRKLIIPSAKLSNAGKYTCKAENLAKSRNVSAVLQVIIPGRVVVTPANGQIYEDQDYEFNCESTAVPPLLVQWRKVENKIEKEVMNTSTVTVFGGKLSFVKAIPTDKGVYECFARLNNEEETTKANLNVLEYMKIDSASQKSVQLKDRRKKTNTLSCAFRGDGQYDVTWTRLMASTPNLPDNMQQVNDTLVITDLKFEDQGVYQCKADGLANTVKANVTLDVFESTKLKTPPKNATVDVGQSIWVNCVAEGTPQPKVSFMRYDEKGAQPLNASHFTAMANGTLYVKHVALEDNGPYLCWLSQFSQIDGSIRAQFYINVNAPVVKKESGSMVKTIAIAVGCAGVYILLVIGLMIYCKARRARLMKKGIITEVDDDEETKDPLLNGIPLQDMKVLDQYEFDRNNLEDIQTLGHGKMGRVFKANALLMKDSEKRSLVAVKEFENNGDEYKAEFNLEVEMFAQLNHEHVVRLLGVTTDKAPFYIITEYSDEGDLKGYLHNKNELTSAERLKMSYYIASGMEFLIGLRYMHRDLAARNCIAYSDKSVKVSFLSLCEDVYKDDYFLFNQVPVPLRWLSPEAVLSESYSEKSDVWSFGVTMWEIFADGAQPYGEYSDEKVQLGVCKDMRLPKPANCPQSVYEVMQKCWILDAGVRPNFSELTSCIAEIELENE